MRAKYSCILFVASVALAFGAATPNHQSDIVETSKGPLKITPLFHGSVMLELDGKVIHVDPWSRRITPEYQRPT